MTTKDVNLSLLETANAFIEGNKLHEAAIVLNQARLVNPEDPRVFMMAALMTEKSGNTQGAFQLMRKGLSLAPNWAPGLISLAKLHMRNGEFAQAMQLQESAVAQDGRNLAVLEGAAEIASAAAAEETLLELTERALALQPDNSNWLALRAHSLHSLYRYDESAAILGELLKQDPKNPNALTQRMYVWFAAGNLEAARADTQTLLELEPDNALYLYYDARAAGQTPSHQPAELNQFIFDQYARSFDTQLVKGLHYQLPKQIANSLHARYPDKKFHLLDLGCGTGLLGRHLGKINGRLVGIDISPKMLEEAEKLKVYDRLSVANMHDVLRDTKRASYDVVTALDVCLYIGDLSETIPAIYHALTPLGQLIFSCEMAPEDGPDLVLHSRTERYAHKRSHVEALCRAAEFSTVDIHNLTLRYEKGQPVEGFVVTAFKSNVA